MRPPIAVAMTRRRFAALGLGALAGACAPQRLASPTAGGSSAADALADIEARVGGRVGVFALDTGSGREIAHRPDERFALCSTFKWVLAAAILDRVDRGALSLDERIPFGPSDLLEYAPVAREHLAEGALTVEAWARAAVIVSDNTAANLLLLRVGGPAGLTRYIRSLGDEVTRLDRDEPTLNANEPGDPRDTTSPRAMVGLLRRLLLGDALSPASLERLLDWLRACETGTRRLRAGFPKDWIAGDKTGTGARGAVNDVAIAWPPGRPPILVAAYLSDSDADTSALTEALAEIGKRVTLSS